MTTDVTIVVDDPGGVDTRAFFPGLLPAQHVFTFASGVSSAIMGYKSNGDVYYLTYGGESLDADPNSQILDVFGNVRSMKLIDPSLPGNGQQAGHLDINLDGNLIGLGGVPITSALGLTPDTLLNRAAAFGGTGTTFTIFGNKGADRLVGSGSADTLDGRGGADLAIGGGGDDTYFVDNAKDVVIELPGGGRDVIEASIAYALPANVEAVHLVGNNGIAAKGNNFANTITGNDAGNQIYGGLGRDTLTGGGGADTFVFRTLAESKVSGSARDLIMDFHHNQHDKIDLHLIDASTKKAGNQSFHFIDDKAFGHHAGELQAKFTAGGHTLVSGDVDGNGKADFAILLDNHVNLHKGDFLL